jgi:hypothetical protein
MRSDASSKVEETKLAKSSISLAEFSLLWARSSNFDTVRQPGLVVKIYLPTFNLG